MVKFDTWHGMGISKGKDIKQIIRNVFWGIVSGCLSTVINFFLTPVIMEKLGVEVFGFVSLSNNIISYLNILTVAVNSFSARFIAEAYHNGKEKEANSYYNSVLFSNVIIAIMIVVPSYFIINKLEIFLNIPANNEIDIKILFFIVLINYFISLIVGVLNTATFLKNKLEIQYRNQGIAILIYSLTILLLIISGNLKVYGIAIASLISSLCLLCCGLFWTNKLTPEFRFDFSLVSLDKIKMLVSKGTLNSINYLGGTLSCGLDLLISNVMLTNTDMSYVAVSNQIGAIMAAIIALFPPAFQPKQLEYYVTNKIDELIENLKYSMKVTGSVALIFYACFLFLGKGFINLWIPEADTEIIFNISVIVLLGHILTAIVTPLYYIPTLKTKMNIVCCVTLMSGVLNVSAMYLLLKTTSFGVYVVVGTTTILNIVTIILFPVLAVKYLNIKRNTFCSTIVRYLLMVCFFSIVYFIVRKYIFVETWKTFILYGFFFSFVSLIICVFVLFDTKERSVFKKNIKKIFNKRTLRR